MRLLIILAFLATSPLFAAQAPAKKDAFKPTDEEQAIIDETNAERTKLKLQPVKPNEKLFLAARKHSENMAKQDKMEHVLDKKTPPDRVRDVGYVFLYTAENIAWNQRNAAELLKEWMNSEIHRTNIVYPAFTEIGIGIARNDKGEPYFTQVFGTPKRR